MKLESGSYLEANQDGTLVMVIVPGPHLASSWYCVGLGCIAIVAAVLLRDAVLAGIGALFLFAGALFLRKAHTRTTEISPSGIVTVTTARVFGGRKTVETFSAQDVDRVDYSEGFESKTIVGRLNRYSFVDITLKDGRNVQVLYRRGVKHIMPLYLPSFAFDTPLAEEAGRISTRLKVPLNTIEFKKITDIKNTYTPNDPDRY